MKRAILPILVLTFGLTTALAFKYGNRNVSVRSNDDPLSDDCSDHMHDYGRHYDSVVRDEESRSLPNQPLNFYAEQNGGIHISTWDRPDFSVKLCKQVASDSDSEGRKILAETKLAVNGDTVSVNSPPSDGDYNLNTLLLVKAPRDARVNMKVQNGGISIKDCAGDVTADVENGGLSITLPQHWDGKGLDAHTENGGLVVGIPRNFNSALEISGSEHVSIICKGDVCENGQRTWDNGRRMFRLGGGTPQIKATTVNGGIVIQNSERSRDMM